MVRLKVENLNKCVSLLREFIDESSEANNKKGIAKLPPDTDTISVTKEPYKPAFIEVISSEPINIFMYENSDDYDSGLTDFRNCSKKENHDTRSIG